MSRRRPATNSDPRIFQLKVTLVGTRPPIWRRIQVVSDSSLEQLHAVLQIVMGWENEHLHEFEKSGVRYSDAEAQLEGTRSTADVTVGDLLKQPKEKLTYVYDFGDTWKHDVVLERIVAEPEGTYPRCVDGRRACPPEDCGGVHGYGRLLAILDDPEDDEHEDAREALGDDFDPSEFDAAQVNRAMHAASR